MVTRSVLHVGPGGPGVPPHTHDGSEIEGAADLIHLRVDQLLAGTITGKEVILAGGAAGVIRSDNFASGVDGWAIFGDGSAELNAVVVRGTIVAGTGSEVDWSYIKNVSIENADIVSLSFDKITAGSNDASLVIGAAGSISSSNYSAGVAGFQIEGNGDAEFNDVTVRGAVIAGAGSSIDWGYIDNVSIGSADITDLSFDKITAATNTASLVVGGAGVIKSANYVAGSTGWQIEGDGDAEFNNVTVRGTIHASAGSVTGNLTVAGAFGLPNLSASQRIELRGGSNIDVIIRSTSTASSSVGSIRGFANGTEIFRIKPNWTGAERFLYVAGSGFEGMGGQGVLVGSSFIELFAAGRRVGLGGFESVAAGAILLRTSGTADTPIVMYHSTILPDAGTHVVIESENGADANEYHMKMITRGGTDQTNFSFRMDGRAEAGGSGQGWFTVSDARTKKNMRPVRLTDIWQRLHGIEVSYYHRTSDKRGQPIRIGPSAQAVQPYFPNSVSANDDTGMLGVSTAETVWALVAAIQDVDRRLGVLERVAT